MTETLETGSFLAPPRFVPTPPPAVVPPYLAPARSRFKGLRAGVSSALAERD